MNRNCLSLVAMTVLAVGLTGCPQPTDKSDREPEEDAAVGGSSGGGSGGRGGRAGTAGSSGGGSAGSSSTGGTAGSSSGGSAGSGSGGMGGSSSGGSGGRAGSGGSGGSGGAGGMAGSGGAGGRAGSGGMDAGAGDTRPGDASSGDTRPSDTGGGAVSFMTDIAPLLKRCGTTCHGGEYNATASAYTRLQGMPSSGACSTMAPFNTQKRFQFLASKLAGAMTCGNKMPQGCTDTSATNKCFTTAEIDKVKAWVAAGAPNN